MAAILDNSLFTGLRGFLETLKTDVINSLQATGSNTTGQTAKMLTVLCDDDNLQLQLPGYMRLLETGRGPTSPGATTSNPPMIQRIQAWCQAKGIPDKAAWAIKKSIDKNGCKGKPGILTEPVGEDNITMRLNPVLEHIASTLSTEIADRVSL